MNIDDYLSKQLQKGEAVVRVVRGHPVRMVPSVGSGGALIILDFFLITWLFRHHGWGSIVFALVMVIGTLLVIRGIYLWSHNILAITNRRVIDIDQVGFFERNVAEATYDKIQEVRYTIRGLWPTLFRLGTIVIQTAGTTTNLELTAVQRPMELQQLITELQRQVQADQPGGLSAAELLSVAERLKAQLGPDGADSLLHHPPPTDHG